MSRIGKPFPIALTLPLLLAACEAGAPAPERAAAALLVRDLAGVVHAVQVDRFDVAGEAATLDLSVGAEAYRVALGEGGRESVRVLDASGRELLSAVDEGGRVLLTGWTGDHAAPFGMAFERLPGDAAPPAASPVAEVDGALDFPPADGAAAVLAPLVEAGNVVAPALALVALPVLLEASSEAREAAGERSMSRHAMLPQILGGALAGGALGAAYCLRSSTSASCSLGDGTAVSITCNACQGTASCTRTVSSSTPKTPETEGAEGDGGTQTVTCTCSCK